MAEELGDGVRILKVDTDLNPDISTQLQVGGPVAGASGCRGGGVGGYTQSLPSSARASVLAWPLFSCCRRGRSVPKPSPEHVSPRPSVPQIQGLPTLIFVGMDNAKPALRTEGLLPAQVIREIVETELQAPPPAAA